ncbi:MAG: NifU family protein [Planctomycetota bacterium]
MDTLRSRVEAALVDLSPLLKVDGGGVELARIEGDTVYLRLTGACIGCPGADITLKYGLESAITESIPEIKRVIAVESREAQA